MIYYALTFLYISFTQLLPDSLFNSKKFSIFMLLIMITIICTVVIINPMGSDMPRYLSSLERNQNLNFIESFKSFGWEPGFIVFQWLLSRITTSRFVYNILIVLIVSGSLIISFKNIIPIESMSLIMFGYLNLFSYYNLLRNVLRQGFAIAFMFFMIVYLAEDKYRKYFIMLLLSLSFHMSAIITSALFVIKKFNIEIKTLIILYSSGVLLMFFNLNRQIMLTIANLIGGELGNQIFIYSSERIAQSYGSVNRIDFLIFTTFWLVWGLFFYTKYLKEDYIYKWLLKSYLTLSTVYLYFAFIAYSDRISMYSWSLIPIILFYPVMKIRSENRKLWVILTMLISLSMFFYFNIWELYVPLKVFN